MIERELMGPLMFGGLVLFMLIGYHETYKIIGMEKPDISFPIQLVGILVALFGVGYYLVARHPLQNRTVLMLGFWSKFLGSCLGTGYVILGKLPPQFVGVYFFADVIYLPFFYLILQRLNSLAAQGRNTSSLQLSDALTSSAALAGAGRVRGIVVQHHGPAAGGGKQVHQSVVRANRPARRPAPMVVCRSAS